MQSDSRRPVRLAILRVGGWENWVHTVAQYLARDGFRVTGLVFERADATSCCPSSSAWPAPYEFIRDRVEHRPFGKIGWLLRSAARLRRHLRAGAFDIIYVVDSWSVPVFYAATLGRLRWPGALTVYHTFEWLDPTVHGAARVWLERAVCRRAALVVNIDPSRARLQQMLYRLPAVPLWIRNSLSREYPVPEPSEIRRTALLGQSVPADAIAIFMPTRAAPDRLGLEAIRACARLPRRFRLALLAGSDDYSRQCAQLARELQVADRVTFLEPMPFDRLMEFVASADVGLVLHDAGVSAGNFLASPMRLSQFAAAGGPFVASDVPSVAADVYRYGLGLCCDPTDPAALANAIRALAENSPRSPERARRLRDTFREYLAFEVTAPNLARRLRSLR